MGFESTSTILSSSPIAQTVWDYVDKHKLVVGAIKDYPNMLKIITFTPSEIKERYSQMPYVKSPKLSDIPSANDPQSHEKQIVNIIHSVGILEVRYQKALTFLAWFEPAWGLLDGHEQEILELFYINKTLIYELAAILNYSERQVYRAKDKAIGKLENLLLI
ncbi:hypothetical protein FACS189465_1370 [Clostridia bacterium]|nr:hypothetical protein FACS189465_1370 [Clostridia bacterium]